jgi:hypothetical protein
MITSIGKKAHRRQEAFQPEAADHAHCEHGLNHFDSAQGAMEHYEGQTGDCRRAPLESLLRCVRGVHLIIPYVVVSLGLAMSRCIFVPSMRITGIMEKFY